MFNTFANAFDTDDSSRRQSNGTNPFDLSPSTSTDPFGISSTNKTTENSADNPFVVQTNTDKSVRPRSGKEALSSSNWLAYQHSMDEANLDSNDDLSDTSVINQSQPLNINNPFATLTDTNSSDNATAQNFAMNFMFDSNSENPFANITTTNDPFGLNSNDLSTATTTTAKFDENSNFSSEQNLTNNSGFNNQFSDWFTQPDSSTNKTEINSTATNDPFANLNPGLSKEQTSQINLSQSTNEELPSIRVHEPTLEHNQSNVVPQDYFGQNKSTKSDDDSDDDDAKMIVKIGEKKSTTTSNTSMPVPLLPPPPTSSKHYKEASDDASSSSSESEHQNDDDDDDDPLAIFRSKSIKNKSNETQGKNLITDWEENDSKIKESVCLIKISICIFHCCLVLSCELCRARKSSTNISTIGLLSP